MTKITKRLIDGNVYIIFKTNDISPYNIPKALNRTDKKNDVQIDKTCKKANKPNFATDT